MLRRTVVKLLSSLLVAPTNIVKASFVTEKKYHSYTVINYGVAEYCIHTNGYTCRRTLDLDGEIVALHVKRATIMSTGILEVELHDNIYINPILTETTIYIKDWKVKAFELCGKLSQVLTKEDYLICENS